MVDATEVTLVKAWTTVTAVPSDVRTAAWPAPPAVHRATIVSSQSPTQVAGDSRRLTRGAVASELMASVCCWESAETGNEPLKRWYVTTLATRAGLERTEAGRAANA